jgi:hypothetical protein
MPPPGKIYQRYSLFEKQYRKKWSKLPFFPALLFSTCALFPRTGPNGGFLPIYREKTV